MAIQSVTFGQFDPSRVPSPCFVVDEVAIENNLKTLHNVQEKSGAKILLALKAFSMFSLAPLINRYLSGCCASGLNEARLAREEFGGEVHTYAAAYRETDMATVLELSDHVIFNSTGQWQRFRGLCESAKTGKPEIQFGLRVNPGHSEVSTPLYDPCAPRSRFGVLPAELGSHLPEGMSGLHFHTLCENDFAALDRTLDVFEEKFAEILPQLRWVNFGGGHHITRPDYDRQALIDRLIHFQEKYAVQVYLEPGEAIAIRSGILVSEVLDITHNACDIAILDSSATCHMPDTLEMPYRADIFHAGTPDEFEHEYRLGGMSCLAGDVMGDYSFKKPLHTGQRLMFDDMAHYTMVKTTTFNGMPLPSLAIWNSQTDELKIVRQFGYEDFKSRLS